MAQPGLRDGDPSLPPKHGVEARPILDLPPKAVDRGSVFRVLLIILFTSLRQAKPSPRTDPGVRGGAWEHWAGPGVHGRGLGVGRGLEGMGLGKGHRKDHCLA